MSNEYSGAHGLLDLKEANFQAEFYHHCRLLGLRCALEYTTPVGRHDAVVFNGALTRIVAIVECKRKMPTQMTWQRHKYETLGMAIDYVCSLADAEELAKRISQSMPDGKAISDIQSSTRFKKKRKSRAERWQSAIDNLPEEALLK